MGIHLDASSTLTLISGTPPPPVRKRVKKLYETEKSGSLFCVGVWISLLKEGDSIDSYGSPSLWS